jgi:hypothetical protein
MKHLRKKSAFFVLLESLQQVEFCGSDFTIYKPKVQKVLNFEKLIIH